MKSSFKNITLGAAALVSTGLAQAAPVTINLVASNGDRNPTQTAIGHILSNSGAVKYQGINGSITGQWTGSTAVPDTARQANFGTWSGTFNGQEVLIQTNYAGALTGIAALGGNIQQRFVHPDLLDWDGSVPDPLTSTDPDEYVVETADFGLSTNFQSTSPFNGWYGAPPVFYSQLHPDPVGVSPLVYVASPGFPAENITSQQIKRLYQSGYLSLAVFTGNAADESKFVFAIGRNHDAGQRYLAYLEPGLGVNDTVLVWQPTISDQQTAGNGNKYGGTVASQIPWPVGITPGGIDSVVPGNGGYTTANDLAPALTVTALEEAAYTLDGELPDATGGYYIGYVTRNDYDQRIAPYGGVLLKYNGVDQSTANIRNGKYTPWLYNRLIRRQGTVTSPYSAFTGYTGGGTASAQLKAEFYEALKAQIANQDATNGGGIRINDGLFRVERQTDGGPVSPTYY